MPAPDQCAFCESTKCATRICTRNLSFDEIACSAHLKDLDSLAESSVPRGTKLLMWEALHSTVRRGDPVEDAFDVLEDM